MASAEVQALISQKVASTMASAEVQAKIDSTTRNQLASSDIQAAMTAEIQKQMADPSVRSQAEAAAEPASPQEGRGSRARKIRNAILSLSDDEIAPL